MKTFTQIKAQAKKLSALSGDEYYKAQDVLKNDLSKFLRTDFLALNKKDLITLIGLVSSHRPMAPHVFIGYFSEVKS